MKLVRVRLQNFRCYNEEVTIRMDNFVMLLGRNDSGKSTILEGLNAFFGEAKLDCEDACKAGKGSEVRIICEFSDYPEKIILDSEHPTDLASEYLLNQEGLLELHQVWNCGLKTPKASMFAMAHHPTAKPFDDLLSLKIAALKKMANEVNADLSNVDSSISAQLRGAIWKTANELALKNTLIPLDKDTGKKIWEQLKRYLPAFALFKADRPSTDADPEAQDPLNTAMREAFKGLEVELTPYIAKIKKEVQSIADRTVTKLHEMHPELASQLKTGFSEPNWSKVLKVNLVSDDDIPLNKRGSGVRRLVLMNFFRAKAEAAAYDDSRSIPVIYAIEEPETSQHPANQKLLIKALCELSESYGCQVIVTSHTPVLAKNISVTQLRHVCQKGASRKVLEYEGGESMKKLAKDLGVLPDHDVQLFIGVEGTNDINFLQTLSTTLITHGVDVPNLTQLENDGKIIFIPCGGTNLALWSHRFANLYRPEFHLFDGDKPEYKKCIDQVNERGEGCIGLLTTKLEMENYLHPDAIESVEPGLKGSITILDDTDVPMMVAEAMHNLSQQSKDWDQVEKNDRKKKASKAKKWLNTKAVAAMTPQQLKSRDPEGEVMGWFKIIADRLNT